MINGIINVYKEAGFTSFDVVAVMRKIAGQKKIGHTGTLDPDAVGVLPVCLGKATKLCGMLTDGRKTYEAVLLLGKVTDTQDISGTVLEEHEVNCTESRVRECIMSFEGPQMQIPPMYSAIKQNGKKLYELAREGRVADRPARPVVFYEITILRTELPRISFRVTCSKGTYIRTLCHDIGNALGCGGCMESLKRTAVGPFRAEDALTLREIRERADAGCLPDIVIPVDKMFEDLPAVHTAPADDTAARNGAVLDIRHTAGQNDRVRIYDSDNIFVGIYRYHPSDGKYTAEKMFYEVH